MKGALSSIRRRLDTFPLWGVVLLNVGLVAVWVGNLRIPDPIPVVDELILGGIVAASAVYTWRRIFGPPSALAAEKRRRLAEVGILHDEIVKAAETAGVSGEVSRIRALLDGIKKIQARIEQIEVVLASPQYSRPSAEAEVARLQAEVDRTVGAAKANLAAALMEAQEHVQNIDRVRSTRDELSAAFERTFQIVRRIHSQVIGIGLAQGTKSDLTSSVDELARTVYEWEAERKEQERAERMVEEELEADRRRANMAAPPKKPTSH